MPELLEVEPVECTPLDSTAAFFEQRPGAGEVAVGQMLIADRDRDQPLERLTLVALGLAPGGLQKLVHLEVEMRGEDRRGRAEELWARADRPWRARGHPAP